MESSGGASAPGDGDEGGSAFTLGLATKDGSGDASDFGEGDGGVGDVLSLVLANKDGSGDARASCDGGGVLSLGLAAKHSSGDADSGDGGGVGGDGAVSLWREISIDGDNREAACVGTVVLSVPSATATRRSFGVIAICVVNANSEPRSMPIKTANASVHR